MVNFELWQIILKWHQKLDGRQQKNRQTIGLIIYQIESF